MVDVNDMVGTPFEQMNCAECAIEVFRRHGVVLPAYEFDRVAVEACQSALRAEYIQAATDDVRWVRVKQPIPPALVVFRGPGGRNDHVGVYIGRGMVIHADRTMGVIVSDVTTQKWRQRIAGYYEYTG